MNPNLSSAHYQELFRSQSNQPLPQGKKRKKSSKHQIHQNIQEYQIFLVNIQTHLH